jgi:hypothetical protein
MITYRLAVLTIRLILAGVGVFYTTLKLFIAPEANPLFILAPGTEQQLPYNTNPTFANLVLGFALILCLALFALTMRSTYKEMKEFGAAAPWSSPTQIALLGFLTIVMGYYTVVSVVIQSVSWNYPITLALIGFTLSLYEGRQYAKAHPLKDGSVGN